MAREYFSSLALCSCLLCQPLMKNVCFYCLSNEALVVVDLKHFNLPSETLGVGCKAGPRRVTIMVSFFSHSADSWWVPTGSFSCCEMAAWPGRSKTSWRPRNAVRMSRWRVRCSRARLLRRRMLNTSSRTTSLGKRKARGRPRRKGTVLVIRNRSCDWHKLLYIFDIVSEAGNL